MDVKNITASRMAAQGVDVEVSVNDDVLNSIADALTATLTLRSVNVTQLMDKDDLTAGFRYALYVTLRQCSGAKPSLDPIPTFLTDLLRPLNGMYRGIRLTVAPLKEVKRPSFYSTFATILQSAGVSMGKPTKVDPYATSKVLLIGLGKYQDDVVLVGVDEDFSLEDLVVRAMLTVSEAEQDKLDRILGHMDMMYVSRDELARSWGTTAMAVPATV